MDAPESPSAREGWGVLKALDVLGSGPIAYALDDGMVFPGWAPPLLADAEAEAGYAAGKRTAVLAGDPADPACGIVLDRRNARLTVRIADPVVLLAYAGAEPTLAEARWAAPDGVERWARRASPTRLQVATRSPGAVMWQHEWLATHPVAQDPALAWPEFGDWTALTDGVRESAPGWIAADALALVDADGWMLAAFEECGVLSTWRELGAKYDAPRAFGLPAEVQVKLAEPLGWQAAGRKWRLTDAVTTPAGEPVSVVSDAVFTAGAGGSGEIITTVQQGAIAVTLDLPSAVARSRSLQGDRGGGYPRPSTGAQVAVTAILEAGVQAHGAVVASVREGRLPAEWAQLGD